MGLVKLSLLDFSICSHSLDNLYNKFSITRIFSFLSLNATFNASMPCSIFAKRSIVVALLTVASGMVSSYVEITLSTDSATSSTFAIALSQDVSAQFLVYKVGRKYLL